MILRPASLRAALELLTRLPVPAARDFDPRDLVDSAAWYPLVGLLLGGMLLGLDHGLRLLSLEDVPRAVLLVLASVLLTGAMHEDGLADAADGLFGGWTPERRLEIMRDSRLGTYGGVALFMALSTRLLVLLELPERGMAPVLLLAWGLSRWGGLVLLAAHPYARAEDGQSVAAQVVNGVGWWHLLWGSLWLLPLCWWQPVLVLMAAVPAITVGVAWSALCHVKVRGMSGDLVGGGILLVELSVLLILGTLPSWGMVYPFGPSPF